MTVATTPLPLSETFAPPSPSELAELVAEGCRTGMAMYPMGGGTSISNGLVPKRSGWGVSLANLKRTIDYPARDMTITVEAGVTMAALADQLAREGQRLPVDAPQAADATLGGVIATATSGPRRYGCGTIRDYVIGITAIDGRGTLFHGGGRVVKNVAGYDFCKLLTGSRGSLGVIAQVTLKLRPLVETTALVACELTDFDQAETLLAALVRSKTTPAAIELLAGAAWADDPVLGPTSAATKARLVVGLEGTAAEIDWMTSTLAGEWRELGVQKSHTINGAAADRLWSRLVEFPAAGEPPLAIKASVLPSAVTRFVVTALELAPGCSVQSHAGSGIVLVRVGEFTAADALRLLIAGLQPAAVKAGGSASVLSCPAGTELTHQAVWGPVRPEAAVMRAVKQQLDPAGLLNPGLASFDLR
ncbi:MAG: FAD-binding oxidoreductase [Planctomycetia bacterium]|nr:FAD-binding oxidoreductase [Planctomycetia bacterium]